MYSSIPVAILAEAGFAQDQILAWLQCGAFELSQISVEIKCVILPLLPVLVSLETGICVPEASQAFICPPANAEPDANAESSMATENF